MKLQFSPNGLRLVPFEEPKQCVRCSGRGLVSTKPEAEPGDVLFSIAKPCSCQEGAVTIRKNRRLLEESGLNFMRYQKMQFDLQPHGYQKEAHDLLVRYALEPKGWIILRGPYGSGKTLLAVAAGNARLKEGGPVLFATVPDLLDSLRLGYETRTFDDEMTRIKDSQFCILDDWGTQKETAWASERLYSIINHRYVRELPTIITTNLERGGFEERIRSRVFDPDLTTDMRLEP